MTLTQIDRQNKNKIIRKRGFNGRERERKRKREIIKVVKRKTQQFVKEKRRLY